MRRRDLIGRELLVALDDDLVTQSAFKTPFPTVSHSSWE